MYDARLVNELRRHHDVEVVEVPPRPSGSLNAVGLRGYDVVLQDELCFPAVASVNPFLGSTVVAVVHLLASEDPTRGKAKEAAERLYMETVDGCIYTSAASRRASPVDVPSAVARPVSRFGVQADEEEVRERAKEDGLQAAFVGNISPVKGLETAVRAVSRVEDWRLSVAGGVADEGYAQAIRSLVRSEGIKDSVDFVGFLDDDELSDLLRESQVVVVPSEYESFGTVYVEGMSFGAPPIASAAGGASEVVENGRNGWLVEPGDTERVASLLRRLRDDRGLLADAGIEALRTARESPSWSETSRKAVEFVERLANR